MVGRLCTQSGSSGFSFAVWRRNGFRLSGSFKNRGIYISHSLQRIVRCLAEKNRKPESFAGRNGKRHFGLCAFGESSWLSRCGFGHFQSDAVIPSHRNETFRFLLAAFLVLLFSSDKIFYLFCAKRGPYETTSRSFDI